MVKIIREKNFYNMGKWSADYDESGICTNVIYSEGYLKLVGNNANDEDNHWRKIVHPDDLEIIDEVFDDMFDKHSEEMDYDLECRMLVKGEYHWFHDFGHVTRREDGSVSRVDGVLFDIQSIVDSQNVQKELVQNNTRFFALEDTFESLYDVELESGHYVSYDRGEFYKKNISDKLVEDIDFFGTLRSNIERVVYEEDQERAYQIQTREAIIKNLSENDHIDNYYRINTETGPMWLKMRIVYKDADKKNVIIGVFNAEEEMAAKKMEEKLREELQQTNNRIFALEDDFESLYDVELESGYYDVFVKGDFYRKTVLDKLSKPADYFKQLRANIDSVIYEEDKEALYQALTKEGICKELKDKDHYDHYYRIKTDDNIKWFKMRVVYKDATKKNIIIGVFNASEEMDIKEKDKKLLGNIEMQLKHEKLRSEVLDFIINHDDDPIEVLKQFAERLLILINCDQVIYRDLEETRIMVNSDGIKDTWSVPIEYCRQCQHFDAFHPMYSDGYTEMSNCQEGWRGIPVYHDCPIKSSLTRLVYCDGNIAGYLAIHYVQKYHQFTDIERNTLEMFARILSLSLSRYSASKKAKEIDSIRRSLNMMFSLSDEFDPIIVIDPKSGKYDWMMSKADEVKRNTSMSIHGDDFYKNIAIEVSTIIHEDDREKFDAFYSKENMLKIATTGESQEIENRWFLKEYGRYLWKYNKAVRMIDENGNAFVVVGVIDTTQKKEEEEKIKETYRRLVEADRRNALLHKAVKASVWSYDIDKNDKVVAAHYDNFTEIKTTISGEEDPMEWLNSIHPEDRERTLNEFNAAICDHSGKTPYETTYRFHKKDDDYLWVKTTGRLNRHEDGTAELFGISVDITEEILEQDKRSREAEESKKLIESISASYYISYAVNMQTDEFKQIRMDSKAVGSDKKFDNFTKVKEFFYTLLPEKDIDNMRHELDYETIKSKLLDTSSYNVEFRNRINGSIIWHIMNITKIDENEVAISFADKDIEITKNHLEDRRFNEYFALYEIDIDSGMLKIVKDSPWYEISRAGTSMPYEPAMKKFAKTLDGDAREFFEQFADIEYVKENFSTEDKRTFAYRSNNVKDKSWVDCTSYVTLRHNDGTPAMFTIGFSLVDSLGVFRQELQQKYVEQNAMLVSQQEELKDARNAADVANQSKSNFLFNMSHDIRTPMNAIRGFTTMAKKHIDDKEKVNEYLDKIDISGEQLLKLINQVLEMARIESGKMELELKPVNVQEEYISMVTVFEEQAKSYGLNFTHSLSGIEHSNILADEARMSSVALNIVGNAMKYTPEGGNIDFSFKEIKSRKSGYATFVLSVEDTGIGMSEEYLKKLYDPFSREKSSTVSKIQGTGLGLSIVKSTVDLMGGDIEVHSEPGKGTRFDITIDFKINKRKSTNAEEISNEIVSFDGRRVLLVEDNEMNREIAKDILEDEGLIIEDAEDGDIAVDMVRKAVERGEYGYYDFILMDVQMPRMNGYEATRAIRAIHGPKGVHIPIIAMTANAFEEDKKNAIEAGMDDHLAKPVDITKLFSALAKYM